MTNIGIPPLDGELARRVLRFLGCRSTAPSVRALDRLTHAYVNRVPWETVFRILKRRAIKNTNACPRLPAEFWHDALEFGGGGTCYENNYAFMSLLAALGYEGYMTVNDLGALHGNHAAGIVLLDGNKYIIDVSIPISRPLSLDAHGVTKRNTALHQFIVSPLGKQRYKVSRTNHPKPDIYILIDRPVADRRYLGVMANDYGPTGQFLSHVLIVKIREGVFWRYNQAEHPRRIQGFGRGMKREIMCPKRALPETLGRHFEMDADHIRDALALCVAH